MTPVGTVLDGSDVITATVMTSIDRDPTQHCLRIEYRRGSNDQFDFCKYVFDACFDGFLKPGDTLVLDNARVHKAVDSFPQLVGFLNNIGVGVLFLPTYSPELNPCELVFAQVKNWLRSNRNHRQAFYVDLATAFSKVTVDNLVNYYRKCIMSFLDNPFVVPPGVVWDD